MRALWPESKCYRGMSNRFYQIYSVDAEKKFEKLHQSARYYGISGHS